MQGTYRYICYSPVIIHAIVNVAPVVNPSVDIPPSSEMTDQRSSQDRANVTTSPQLVEVLVDALQLAGATDRYPSHFAARRYYLIVHQMWCKGVCRHSACLADALQSKHGCHHSKHIQDPAKDIKARQPMQRS